MDQNHWFLDRMVTFGERLALSWHGHSWTYLQLCLEVQKMLDLLGTTKIDTGDVVSICGDYSPNTCALLLALAINKNIVVPIATASNSS